MSDAEQTDLRLRCPGCGEDVDVPPESAGKLVRCPYCSTDFFADPERFDVDVVDDTEELPAAVDELIDKNRVKRYATLRMATVRGLRWWRIGILWSAASAAFFVLDTVSLVAAGKGWVWPIICMSIASGLIRFCLYCRRRAFAARIELDKPTLVDPPTPPDFSTLGNGSQWHADFDRIR